MTDTKPEQDAVEDVAAVTPDRETADEGEVGKLGTSRSFCRVVRQLTPSPCRMKSRP